MSLIHEKFQIVETGIFGFDSVSCNSNDNGRLEDHPGFRIMVDKVNQESVDLEWWMGCEVAHIGENRNGLLWKHIESTDVSKMTRAQLVERVRKWAPLVREVAELRQINAILNDHNATLVHDNRELAKSIEEERAFSHELLMKRLQSSLLQSSSEPSVHVEAMINDQLVVSNASDGISHVE